MSQDPIEARRQLFAEMCLEIVQSNYARGVRSLGAMLKPELAEHARARGEYFDQESLGFVKFSDFLLDAADRVPIEVQQSPGRPDFEAVPSGKPVRPKDEIAPRRVKRAWVQHFTETVPGTRSAFDRRNERLRRVPVDHWSDESPWLVPVEPITDAIEREWLDELLVSGRVAAGLVASVNAALERGARTAEAAEILYADADAGASWATARANGILAFIENWKTQNAVSTDIFSVDRPVTRRSPSLEHPNEPPGSAHPHEGRGAAVIEIDQLRMKIHQAVDRMSIGELLQLRLPVEYLL